MPSRALSPGGLARDALGWVRAKVRGGLERVSGPAPSVYLDLASPPRDRYLYLLARLLSHDGRRVALTGWLGPRAYRRLDPYARLIFGLDPLLIDVRRPRAAPGALLVTDRAAPEPPGAWRRVVRLRLDIGAPPPRDPWRVVPFPMHPFVYARGQEALLPALRARARTRSLFFSGNDAPALYDDLEAARLFARLGLLPRRAVLSALREGLSPGEQRVVRDADDLARVDDAPLPGVFLLVERGPGQQLYVVQERWLEALARSDFFLCPPGAVMPPCHNAVEAMAVGTIPLTNYPDWFHPPLVDGETCLAFKTRGELVARARAALSMGPAEVAALRARVVAYYERHLEPRRLLEDLDRGQGELHLFYVTEDRGELARVGPGAAALAPLRA